MKPTPQSQMALALGEAILARRPFVWLLPKG